MSKELKDEIIKLKEEKNAIILAHNYQPEEIQEISDFIGDSLELCIEASKIKDKDIIVFCGVYFMAETAAILNPDKKILIPDPEANCPMADMLERDELLKYQEKYPDAKTVLYINTLADSKAEADILCTSANAKEVVDSLDCDRVLFGPDKNLGTYVADMTNKNIVIVPPEGHCYVHDAFTREDILTAREKYPSSDLLVHPECRKEIQDMADHIMSTGKMVTHIANSESESFIIATEVDLITRIRNEVPNKKVYPASEDAICETMKVHSLEKIKNSLINEYYVVKLDENIAKRSKKAIDAMLNVKK